MEKQTINIDCIGSIHRRKDGLIHLYLMADRDGDITHEIVLSEYASQMFCDCLQIEVDIKKALGNKQLFPVH